MSQSIRVLIAFAFIFLVRDLVEAKEDENFPVAIYDHLECECDEGTECDAGACEHCARTGETGSLGNFRSYNSSDFRLRTPAMLGGFYGGNSFGFRGDATLDRLIIVADDLDAPAVLPGGSTLTITEPGPVGIFSSTVGSIQQLQTLFRAGNPIPAFNLEGSVVDNATLTTLSTVSDIQAQLAGTGVAYDIILLSPPPGTYEAAVGGVFLTRNGFTGTTVLNTASSGALIQGGVDTLNGGEDLDAFYFYDYVVRLNTAMADISSGGVGRVKISENGVVLPQDRVFFNYGNIYNTTYAARSRNLNRFVGGFERAFLDNLMSFELRAPFATDAVNDYSLAGNTITNGATTRFGNLSLYLKSLLFDDGRIAVSGGLGISLPTATDTRISYADGTDLLHLSSEAVHLQPFLGMLYTPNQRCFAQAFAQYDIAANGNSVAVDTGSGLTTVGSLTDANHLLFDGSIGYWLYKDNRARGLTGIIPTFEFHQTVATSDGDIVSSGPFQVGSFNGNRSITSLVGGTTFEFGCRTQITAGYTAALGGDRDFDGAFQIQLNHLLGR